MNKKIEHMIANTTYPRIKADCGTLDPQDTEHLTSIITCEEDAEIDDYGIMFVYLKASAN